MFANRARINMPISPNFSQIFDKQALGGHYEISTDSNARALQEMTALERSCIPQREWEKLNFKLITGSSDAHGGNISYRVATQKLHLTDTGSDFMGSEGQCQYYNPWVADPKARLKMSVSESCFLEKLDINQIMDIFEQGVPEISTDQYLTQILRLYLAKMAGKHKLTQAEWFQVMGPRMDPKGKVFPGNLDRIYKKYIAAQAEGFDNWREVAKRVPWHKIYDELEIAIAEQLQKRPKHPGVRPAFHV